MAKTTRKTGKRATAAGRGELRARKAAVAKTHDAKQRKLNPARPGPRKGKPSLPSETTSLKRQLKAARMQQEASAEILRAVAKASGDVARPLQQIAETTARLFGAPSVSIQLAEGGEFTREYRVGAIAQRVGSANPRSNIRVGGRNLPGTVVSENRQIHIPDLNHLDPSMSDFPGLPHARAGGARTVCGTPLRREGKAIGVLIIFRNRLLPFTEDELALQQSFADQAVIAIENARLFNETKRALERQTATADVLRIISRSVAHAAPVFDTILESCERLFNPYDAAVYLVEGDRVRGVARRGPGAGDWGADSMPLEGSSTGVAIAQGQPVHFPDLADKADLPEDKRAVLKETGGMTVLYAPMISQDSGVGSLVVTRRPKKPFTETEIDFIQSFADQAVIAIENVRLFDEVQARTRDLTESLQQQTATADVLKVISRSAFDLQTVLETLTRSAVELCSANRGIVMLRDGDRFHFRAHSHPDENPDWIQFLRQHPQKAGRNSASARSIQSGEIVCVPDVLADPEIDMPATALAGIRAVLAVPLLRDGKVEGLMVLSRPTPCAFNSRQIDLVQTFADQAVIAIENVRLFDEVEAKTRDLSEALAHQTGSSNILKVIASSPTDVGPVLTAIAENAAELCDAYDAAVLLKVGDDLHFSAHHGSIPIGLERWPINRNWTAGRAFLDRKPVHIHDLRADENADFSDGRELSLRMGHRSILSVPLLREKESIGAIVLRRKEVHPFSDKQIALLQTFADQAVIAIENVRLFNETQEALEVQKASADILNVISHSVADPQPVFDKILRSIEHLFGAEERFVLLAGEDGLLHIGAVHGPNAGRAHALFPVPLQGSASEVAIRERRLVTHANVFNDIDVPPVLRETAHRFGKNYSMAVAPMLWEDRAIGSIFVGRTSMEPFSEKECSMLRTFADQAVIAIQNARMFEEVQAKTHELSQSLDDLRAAQDRLVQTEKLASLGQLTAGIAHEIKNPLNFVNNFSALSAELVDELNDTLKPAVLESKMRLEVDDLTEMLKGNLEKVVQHGKRADSIVKNMLLHSREGSGEHRPTDVNALLDESLNLAYHGARAEKSEFNITLQKDFDNKAGMIEVFPQEITRAFLNFISNGFYAAVKRKAENGNSGFEPALRITTMDMGQSVEIRIRDNGTGIPTEVKEKMFNPFFTTKPAGEGTGLGLSMSHDIIVKQHGGAIDVETEPGQFTEFRIVLPRLSNISKKN
jgi:GAF domain-containing protein